MTIDRAGAASHISGESTEKPEAYEASSKTSLALAQEQHRHDESMNDKQLGVLGRVLGSPASASISVAFIVIVFSLLAAVACGVAAYSRPENGEFWQRNLERMIALALTALSYIFGKSQGNSFRN